MTSYEHKVKNIYLGSPNEPREPGTDTLLYIKGEGDVLDYSGNNVSTTAQHLGYATEGNLTYINLAGQAYNGIYLGRMSIGATRTFSFWISPSSGGKGSPKIWAESDEDTKYFTRSYNNDTMQMKFGNTNVNAYLTTGVWQNVIATMDKNTSTVKVYKNGTLLDSCTYNITGVSSYFHIGYGGSSSHYMNAKLSNIIVESGIRSDQDILNYFNDTKSKYGIS